MDPIKEKLLGYQIAHVDNLTHILTQNNRCLDASDTGTGKTYTAIAAALILKLRVLVICPKSVITSWEGVLKFFKAKYYGITNYESIHNCKFFTQKSPKEKVPCPYIKRVEVKQDSDTDINAVKISKDDKYGFTYVWKNLPNDMLVVFDETHRCKNPRTLNSILIYTLAQTKAKILMLSATVSDKPENFAMAGYVLGLYTHLRMAPRWAEKVGREFNHVTVGIHHAIYPKYAARMRIRDLGTLFPDNQIIANCYDMDNAVEIQEQYKLIEDEIVKLKNKEDNSGCALSRILYARMRIEQLKVPTIIEQTKKYLDEGNSVAIFVNFTQSLQLLADELDTKCVVYGQQTMEERAHYVRKFNTDKSRVIICNIQSGGEGISLHDTKGEFPRVSIISPSWSAQKIVQCLGRIHRANTKSAVRQRIVFCANSVEEMICENMRAKIINIAQLNDGDLLGYHIEGLTDGTDTIGVDMHANLSEIDKLFLKLNVLHLKKARLENDLEQTNTEIQELSDQISVISENI